MVAAPLEDDGEGHGEGEGGGLGEQPAGVQRHGGEGDGPVDVVVGAHAPAEGREEVDGLGSGSSTGVQRSRGMDPEAGSRWWPTMRYTARGRDIRGGVYGAMGIFSTKEPIVTVCIVI